MAKRSRERRDAGGWQRLMEEQAASGLSRKVFCEREGIPRSSFETWRRRLASGAGVAPFVDVTPPVPRDRWEVELALPGGVVLRLRG